jgi:2-phospho-L-lactate guanylyltransferase
MNDPALVTTKRYQNPNRPYFTNTSGDALCRLALLLARMPEMSTSGNSWSVIVPVKRLDNAKTRLDVRVDLRADLAVAMAYDTVAAIVAAEAVAEVVVVTDDARARELLSPLGVRLVRDEPDAGLNAALAYGADQAEQPLIAAISSDLAALRTEDVTAVLSEAARHDRAVVADLPGRGTTLLAATHRDRFVPAYGTESFAAHLAAGAVDITASAQASVRRDVDTLAGLREAIELGVGPATRAALDGVEL